MEGERENGRGYIIPFILIEKALFLYRVAAICENVIETARRTSF